MAAFGRTALESDLIQTLFDDGFRTFFLLVGLDALAIAPVWLCCCDHYGALFRALPAMYCHSHEMFYGFVVATISGIWLTAVPRRTGARKFGGAPLIAVVVRIFGGVLWPQRYALAVSIAGLLWMVSFVVDIFVYAPILVGPRADGQPG